MQIDGYRVLETVHEGLYGPVLRGQQERTEREVAIQIFSQAMPQTSAAVQALHAHVQALHKLNLPSAPAVLAGGQLSSGQSYVVSEWLTGTPLHRQAGPVPYPLRCAQQIAACLTVAHQQNIYHLHLRPTQILVELDRRERPRCAVLGLGVASLFGLPLSTMGPAALAGLAPERRLNREKLKLPGAADVYSLAVLIRALLGLPPSSALHELGAVRSLDPAMAQKLGQLLREMLDADPQQRPTMSQVNGRLFEFLKADPQRLLSRLAESVVRGKPTARRTTLSSLDAPMAAATLTARVSLPTRATSEATASRPIPPTKDPLIDQVFGKFRLIRRIGGGAMGTVYEARHEIIEHRAAVKVMRSGGSEMARRFLDEARAVNIVEHPGLVSIFEFGQREDGLLFIVMEFLSGQTLEAALGERKQPFDESEVLTLGLQAAHALSAAHTRGVVHRDLKPSNIMLVADSISPGTDRIKILDFGIAKLNVGAHDDEDNTKAGAVLGTVKYMAPEQYGSAGEVDGKADVFALGVVLYEMLSGESPFGEGVSFAAVAQQPPLVRSKRATVSRSLSRLVARMLPAEPQKRPTMKEVTLELQRLIRRRELLRRAGPGLLTMAVLLIAAVVWFVAARPPSPVEVQARQASLRQQAEGVLRRMLHPKNPPLLRAEAARALGRTRDPNYIEVLKPLIRDPDDTVAHAAIEAIGMIEDLDGAALLRQQFESGPPERQVWAAQALAGHPLRSISEPGRTFLRARLHAAHPESTDGAAVLRFDIAVKLLAAGESRYQKEVREGLQRLDLDIAKRLRALELLARTEENGQHFLKEIHALAVRPESTAEQQLMAIASLESLGQYDPALHGRLRQAAQPGPQQVLGNLLLVQRADRSGCQILAQVLKSSSQPEPMRILAADGLPFCGLQVAQELAPLLDSGSLSQRLAVELAGNILRVVGPDPERLGIAQLQLAANYLQRPQSSDRLAAIALIEASPDESGVDLLQLALADSEIEVRKAAARVLGTRRIQSAFTALTVAIEDANTDVREEGMRAALQLLGALKQTLPAQAGSIPQERLREIIQRTANPSEKIVARAILLRLGDRTQQEALRVVMNDPATEEKHRLLIIEIINADNEIIRAALSDRSVKVQFFAARRRFEQRGADAIPVLEAMLNRPGNEALLAYWMLRGLGKSPPPPSHLADLLGHRFDIDVRQAVVRIVGGVEVDVALPILYQAMQDPAAVVRKEVARAAVELYKTSRNLRLIDVLSSLTSDPEVAVRMQALTALRTLVTPRRPNDAPSKKDSLDPKNNLSSERGLSERSASVIDMSVPPDLQTGQLTPPRPVVAADSLDRSKPARLIINGGHVSIDRFDIAFHKTVAAGSELNLAPGRYTLQNLCGDRLQIELRAGQTLDQSLPCEAEQSLKQARIQLTGNNAFQAEQVLRKAMKQMQGRERQQLYSLIQFAHGEALSASGRLQPALGEWNAVWERIRNGAVIPEIPTIEQRFARFKGQVGRFTARAEKGGRCVVVWDQLYLHGDRPLVTIAGKPYRPEQGSIQAGVVSKIDLCSNPPAAVKKP